MLKCLSSIHDMLAHAFNAFTAFTIWFALIPNISRRSALGPLLGRSRTQSCFVVMSFSSESALATASPIPPWNKTQFAYCTWTKIQGNRCVRRHVRYSQIKTLILIIIQLQLKGWRSGSSLNMRWILKKWTTNLRPIFTLLRTMTVLEDGNKA